MDLILYHANFVRIRIRRCGEEPSPFVESASRASRLSPV